MKQLICKECGAERSVGRRLCNKCNSKRICSYDRYTWTKTCTACKLQFEAWRKTQEVCRSCYDISRRIKSETKNTNNYIWKVSGKLHEYRHIAQNALGRNLQTNEVVHHINDDPKDNRLENLMVMDRRSHGKLHQFLDLQRVIWEKSQNENHGNCWNNLIVPITTTWLETASVKVIKIWEIGQSAAEPLKSKGNEEGSETTLVTSATDNAVEEDIVQTTT